MAFSDEESYSIAYVEGAVSSEVKLEMSPRPLYYMVIPLCMVFSWDYRTCWGKHKTHPITTLYIVSTVTCITLLTLTGIDVIKNT